MGNEILILQLLLAVVDMLEPLTKSKLTPQQRASIRDARRAVAKAIREQE